MISRILFVLLACVAFSGCESVRNDFTSGVREKFNGPTYQKRVFTADSQVLFEAARASAEELGFRVTRAGAAQGVIEGLSALASDDRLSGSRQRTIKVRLESTLDQGVELAVLFTEVVQDDFAKGAGQGTETTLRDSPLYEAFFNAVGRRLVR
ncbi:MAG: hypothetical protein ABW223_09575 [Rariglobus sp.]